MAKLIFIDTETTGLDHRKHGIWQLGGCIEIDGKVVEEFNLFMNPGDVPFEDAAMEAGNVTEGEIKGFPPQEKVFKEFQEILSEHINKFDKNDKAFLVAYNSRFDDGFIREWFLKNGDKFYGSWFYSNFIDVHTLVGYVTMGIRNQIKSYKLSEIAPIFNVEPEMSHDALDDVRTCYKLFKVLQQEHLTVTL